MSTCVYQDGITRVVADTEDWVSLERVIKEFELSVDQKRCLQSQVVAQWVEALGNWDAFFTGTFETSWSERHATKAFEKWCRQTLWGRSVFYVTEQHPLGHGAHVHALLATQGAYRRTLWQSWFERYGRCRIEPIASRVAVAAYCYKYVLGREMTKQFRRGVWWNLLNCHRREELSELRQVKEACPA